MGVLAFLVLGLAAGAIAKLIHRGEEPGGVLGTLAVGVVGAIVGGLIASAVGLGGLGGLVSVGTWLIAIAGAFLLLVVYNLVASSSGP